MAKDDSTDTTQNKPGEAAARSKKSRAARDAMAKGATKTGTTARGGSGGSERRDIGFPAAVAAVVVLGLGAVLFARSQLTPPGTTEPRLGLDHWHSAYGLYICSGFQPNPVDTQGDARGVHTHNDGIMHIHPTSSLAAGDDAQIGDFLFEIGVELTDDELRLPNGDTYANGDSCGDVGEGTLRLLRWNADDPGGEPEIITENLNDTRLLADREAFTLAFAPADAEIPLPPTVQGIDEVTDVIEAPGTTVVQVPQPEDSESDDGGDSPEDSDSSTDETGDESEADTSGDESDADESDG